MKTNMKTVVRSNFILLAIIGMLVCTGLAAVSQIFTASNSSSASADVGRRHIEVTSDDGSATVKAEEGQIKIATASTKITIEGERILLNAVEIAKLPASAGKITVKVADGQITITADGAPIDTVQLKK
jgi:hypothetical protein